MAQITLKLRREYIITELYSRCADMMASVNGALAQVVSSMCVIHTDAPVSRALEHLQHILIVRRSKWQSPSWRMFCSVIRWKLPLS